MTHFIKPLPEQELERGRKRNPHSSARQKKKAKNRSGQKLKLKERRGKRDSERKIDKPRQVLLYFFPSIFIITTANIQYRNGMVYISNPSGSFYLPARFVSSRTYYDSHMQLNTSHLRKRDTKHTTSKEYLVAKKGDPI